MLVDKEKIQKAKAKLGDRNADIIAELLHVEKWDSKNKKGCCPWHNEDTPSFIYNPKAYNMKCFGCSRNTDIIDAYMHTGLTYVEALRKLFDEAKMDVPLGEQGVKTKTQYRYPKEETREDKTEVYEYLAKRGISKETADKAQIGEDPHGNVVFNYYDTNDVLTMVKYRPSHKIDKAAGEVKNWCQKDADTTPLLFNMNRVNVDQPLLVTEGEGDTLAALEAGYSNAVSVPFGAGNFSWIEENFEWLEQFDNIIICSDNDEAGVKMQKECVSRLGSWRTRFVEIPPTVTSSDGATHRVKDLNEILYYQGKEAVMNLIHNAKDPGVPSVQDVSDITETDLDEIDGITTGISELDSELMKLFYGTLTILSGQPGAGKTSFISQLVCQAINEGQNAWVYSREMPAWMTKSWLNYIMAGRHNIKRYENSNGCTYYKVTQDAKEAINETYRGQWVVYRDDASNKFSDVLQSMEDCVRKYGSKLLILDNLMTLDFGADESNENLKQTEVINQLIYFAMRYSVAVVLVAHPRKLMRNCDVGIYDLSGTANIINLAHRTISLKRLDHDEDKTNYDVQLTILKDRMRGKAGKKINLYYDVPSRRFYTNEAEFEFQYHWDTEKHAPLPYPHGDEREVYGEPL